MIFNNTRLYQLLAKPQEISYCEVILFGLNYSFAGLDRRTIQFNLQYGDHFIIKLPTSIVGRIYKRRLVLFGNNRILKHWIYSVMTLRFPNAHTGKGLRLRVLPYRVKPGKERKR